MPTSLTVTPSLRHAWAGFLSQRPWDLFLTLTSERRTHPEALFKRFRYCTHKISDHCYGKRVTRVGSRIEYVIGVERHKSGWPHSHAVMRLPAVDVADPGQFSLAEWQKWITETGGFCHLARPHSSADVVDYCAKYVVKDGELVLSDNLQPYEQAHPGLFDPRS